MICFFPWLSSLSVIFTTPGTKKAAKVHRCHLDLVNLYFNAAAKAIDNKAAQNSSQRHPLLHLLVSGKPCITQMFIAFYQYSGVLVLSGIE